LDIIFYYFLTTCVELQAACNPPCELIYCAVFVALCELSSCGLLLLQELEEVELTKVNKQLATKYCSIPLGKDRTSNLMVKGQG